MTEHTLTEKEKGLVQIEVAALRAGHRYMRDVFAVIEGILAAREAKASLEVVLAIEGELDDADQIVDSLEHPNYITVWGVRRALYPFGGREHRWRVPAERCAECDHLAWNHNDNCAECGCLLSRREAEWGRDEALDAEITQAIWEDAVTNDEPWARDT